MFSLSAIDTRLIVLMATLVIMGMPLTAPAEVSSEALQEYVQRPDDSYDWVVRQRMPLGACEVVEFMMTSQTWRDLKWQHRLFLVVPPEVKPQADTLLVIDGGSWHPEDAEALGEGETSPIPKEAVLLGAFAEQLGAPIAILLNVPRQPIFEGRKEDAIVALTFDRFLESGDTDWPLLLPMVKSAVRAMDTLQAFAAEDLDVEIKGFTVAGASKRGWTTWLTAAVDGRVRGLAPMVIDMLNLEKQFPHQLEAYGEFSDRIHDYVKRDLPRRMSGESGAALRQIVDPYSYRDQITQPKMLFLGTNDGYWTVDALNLYWDDLVGEKYIVYVPNADHDLSMDWQRILAGLQGLHRHAHGQESLPPITWQYEGLGSKSGVALSVKPGAESKQVLLWSADSPTKDFREVEWSSQLVEIDAQGDVFVEVSAPSEGYRAMFVEVAYEGGLLPLRLSTTIRLLQAAK